MKVMRSNCRDIHYGEIAMAALAGKLKDPSPTCAGDDRGRSGECAWRSAVAQEALAQFASVASKTSEIEERALAIDAIGQALKLGSHLPAGHRPVQGAVTCSTTTARPAPRAFAVLQPAQAVTYKPEADKAARKARSRMARPG